MADVCGRGCKQVAASVAGVTGDFLSEREPVTWVAPQGFPASLRPAALFVQDAPHGLEVVLATAGRKPSAADLRTAWEKRRAGRVSPVLLVAVYPVHGEWGTALCGPAGEQPAVHDDIELSQAERLAAVALDEPNRRARPLLGLRGRPLVERLGFGVEVLSTNTSLLTVNGRNRAIAVFCDEEEPFDAPAQRFDGTSPVSRGLAVADQKHVDWVILTRAAEVRLYAARPDTGVGRKGRAETFVELNLSLLPADLAGYLPLLFSAEALAENGTLERILDESDRFASSLAVRLRDRVYFETVPMLAQAVAARLGYRPTENDLDAAYEQVMVILFRLLFVAYAEDKDLLPYRTNSHYADHSLKKMAIRLTEDRRAGQTDYDSQATDQWDDVRQLWRAVDMGNTGWGVPAYDGGLFSHDPDVSPSGAALAALQLTDAEFAPALGALLVDKGEGDEGYGPVDFRSLSVREFGTIYEGLLESRLAVAQDDLTVRKVKGKDQYVPAAAFFDFRCADIAMGSGHFLVAALDRIEARLSAWLALHPVPGLPLSLLDHNLMCGDSLTGVGTLDEVVAALDPNADPEAPSLFRSQILALLARAENALRRLARTSDATKKEIDEARDAHREAQAAVRPAQALFDLVTAHRSGICPLQEKFDEGAFIAERRDDGVGEMIRILQPVHFPAAFPEVFLRAELRCTTASPPFRVRQDRRTRMQWCGGLRLAPRTHRPDWTRIATTSWSRPTCLPRASTCSRPATSSTTTCRGIPCGSCSATAASTGSARATARCSSGASSPTPVSTTCWASRSGCTASSPRPRPASV